MRYVYTIFDHSGNVPRPLKSIVFEKGSIKTYTFFAPKSGNNLYEIFSNIEKFKSLLTFNVVLNDFKSHISGFGIDPADTYNIYDIADYDTPDLSNGALKKKIKDVVSFKKKPWNKILANVQTVYHFLEERGIYNGYQKLDFKFGTTYTGRSKTSGFNIQGSTDEDDIRIEGDYNWYINFDWTAADIRAISIMSGDEYMAEAFKESDPYTEISDALDIPRPECKLRFLKGIYSLSFDDPIFEVYPQAHQWFKDKLEEMNDTGKLYSMLGREFVVGDDHKSKSVFSGMIQGSVAHAMHNVLSRVFSIRSHNLIMENHDSITMVCRKNDIGKVIEDVKEIMLYPFWNLLDDDLTFPFRVYVGKGWRKWELYKEFK